MIQPLSTPFGIECPITGKRWNAMYRDELNRARASCQAIIEWSMAEVNAMFGADKNRTVEQYATLWRELETKKENV